MKQTGLLAAELKLDTEEQFLRWPAEGTPRLELSLALPRLSGAAKLNAYYRRLGLVLCRYCASELLPSLPAESEVLRLAFTSRTELVSDRLLSLRCDLCRSGPRSLSAARFGAVWDRQTGAPLPLGAFFPDVRMPLRRVRAFLREEALRRCESRLYAYAPDRAARAGRLFSPRDLYAAPEGLRVFLPALSLGDAWEGIPEFTIPWGERGAVIPAGAES